MTMTNLPGNDAGMREATKPLGRFDHHPDPSTDFCIEVEALQGWSVDMRAGRRSQWPFWGRLGRLLRFIKTSEFETLDAIAQKAKPLVLGLEQSVNEPLPVPALAPQPPKAETPAGAGEDAKHHAITLEQCALFVDSEPLRRGMVDAAAFLRSLAPAARAGDGVERYSVPKDKHRSRIQAIGAAISRRDWSAVEQAHADIRDALDRPDIYELAAAPAANGEGA